jgi:hypothetical protein
MHMSALIIEQKLETVADKGTAEPQDAKIMTFHKISSNKSVHTNKST